MALARPLLPRARADPERRLLGTTFRARRSFGRRTASARRSCRGSSCTTATCGWCCGTSRPPTGPRTTPPWSRDRVLAHVQRRSIVLLHDGLDGNPHADRSVLLRRCRSSSTASRRSGLEPVRLDRLLGGPAYARCPRRRSPDAASMGGAIAPRRSGARAPCAATAAPRSPAASRADRWRRHDMLVHDSEDRVPARAGRCAPCSRAGTAPPRPRPSRSTCSPGSSRARRRARRPEDRGSPDSTS